MIPLRDPARLVVMRAGLKRLLRETAAPLGLAVEDAVDLAMSVLADIKAEKADTDLEANDDGRAHLS